jgi:lipid-binding SYLF domain-containing protein
MKIKKIVGVVLVSGLLFGCATGNTPDAKKKNARKATSDALALIYKDHPASKAAAASSLGYLVCTGSDSYLFAASTGGGVCTFNTKGKIEYYRFASLGVGAGIGFKKSAFMYTYSEAEAMRRFKEEGWDAGARAEASAKNDESGGQAAANTSYDVDGVRIFQSAIWGAAAQATVQGYKFWPTDFTDDVMENSE